MSTALVALPRDTCPECGSTLDVTTAAQLPLFRHGGFGEVQESRLLSCRCGYFRLGARTSENPRRR